MYFWGHKISYVTWAHELLAFWVACIATDCYLKLNEEPGYFVEPIDKRQATLLILCTNTFFLLVKFKFFTASPSCASTYDYTFVSKMFSKWWSL